jgi:aminoglycoside phosphotransferase (APT) family kinase protein
MPGQRCPEAICCARAVRRLDPGKRAIVAPGLPIASLPVPDGELVFVHGDLWQGNTVWIGDSCSGMIDWDAAGAGSPGIDLGTLRRARLLVSAITQPSTSRQPACGAKPETSSASAEWEFGRGAMTLGTRPRSAADRRLRVRLRPPAGYVS